MGGNRINIEKIDIYLVKKTVVAMIEYYNYFLLEEEKIIISNDTIFRDYEMQALVDLLKGLFEMEGLKIDINGYDERLKDYNTINSFSEFIYKIGLKGGKF